MAKRTIGQPIPSDLLAELRLAAELKGELALLDGTGLSADTLARALGGLRVHAGTRAAVELYLSRST
jgi:hypothetical protein